MAHQVGSCPACHKPEGCRGLNSVQHQREWHSIPGSELALWQRVSNACSRDSGVSGTAKRMQLIKILEICHLCNKTQPYTLVATFQSWGMSFYMEKKLLLLFIFVVFNFHFKSSSSIDTLIEHCWDLKGKRKILELGYFFCCCWHGRKFTLTVSILRINCRLRSLYLQVWIFKQFFILQYLPSEL